MAGPFGAFFIGPTMSTETDVTAAPEGAPTEGATTTEAAAPQNVDQQQLEQSQQQQTDQPNTDDAQSEAGDAEKPRRPSRTDRMKRRVQAMSTEIDNLKAQLAEKDKADREPVEADFNGDYFAFMQAKTAYDARRAIREELNADRISRLEDQHKAQRQELTDSFDQGVNELRGRIADYDETVERYAQSGGRISDAVRDELLDSDQGPLLLYHLAKNPATAQHLNRLSPREVAREIGRMEASLNLPSPRTQTKAPAPLASVNGGASPPTNLASLAKSDDASAYWEARRKGAG
ncbi:MAG TPA: hypothetical protein VNQ99_12310 [Xanthobacteraceae bacterium]|nr:hypothetical protein [Xanthobacteraceae bacterium]